MSPIETWIRAAGLSLNVRAAGGRGGPAVVLLHGWPQDSTAYDAVMAAMGEGVRCFALDLPGIGGSHGKPPSGEKRRLAAVVRAAVAELGLQEVTLVGHDVGGMVAYAYLRAFPGELARAAILDVAIPGLDPWPQVVRDPRIWHFAFHAVPELPERLVDGHQARYFDYFFDAIAGPNGVSPQARRRYAEAYERPEALSAGFDWYRAFETDARWNAATFGEPVTTPVLYLRGDAEAGPMDAYLEGLRAAGLARVEGAVLADCGHFSPDEQPQALAAALAGFMGLTSSSG
jgi:pimeloyl-ACP methyl ester carboxylesterase